MIAALEGDMGQTQKEQMMIQIENDEHLTEIWENYNKLYSHIELVAIDVPSLSVKHNFSKWLAEEAGSIENQTKRAKVVKLFPWRKWAGIAAVFVCVLGFWQVYNKNQQMGSSLANLELMMQVQSPTERIKAIRVNYKHEQIDVDGQMIEVLVNVLFTDKSSNVRLAAVETLSNYMDSPKVRTALIKAIATEKDGGVKLAIIDSLGKKQNKEIISTLENIVNDDSQEKYVIDGAHMQLIRLDKVDI
ncbi:MAG: hypothetical protein ACJA1A_002381 [Saprospiraceae bacterium]|jgi:hypothetical protein